MKCYAGIDVSLDSVSVCVVDDTGKVRREAKFACEPGALVAWFRGLDITPERIGLEAGPLSQWLHAGLQEAGLAAELLETRHVRTAFKTMPVKTDRKDARGIAQLMRMGWFRPVHCKSIAAQETRSLLTTRKLILNKRMDMEMGLRGILRGFGLKIGPTTPRTFEARVRDLVDGHPTLLVVAEALLTARGALVGQLKGVEKRLVGLARDDAWVRRLMSTPGVGVIVALTYVSAIDDPGTLQVIEGCWSALRLDTQAVSVRGDGCHWRYLEDWRRWCSSSSLRGGQCDPDPAGEGLDAEELGGTGGGTSRDEEGEGGAGPQARRHSAQDAGRRNHVHGRHGRGARCGMT